MLSRLIILTLTCLVLTVPAWSVGALFVRPLRSTANLQAMHIKTYDAKVEIQDHVATTLVEQTVYNSLAEQVESTFIFPLPPGAMITDMRYEFNGKWYVASVRERKEAQQAYDSKVRRVLDPALLQELGDNLFKLNIAPINARSDVRFKITYTEIIPYALGSLSYKHILKTTGLSPLPLERVSLTIKATSQTPIVEATTPAYANATANAITIVSPNEVNVSFGDEHYLPEKDYTFVLKSSHSTVEMTTMTYVPVEADSFGTDPFFATWVLTPDNELVREPINIVITADVSSSMEGMRIVQLRKALEAFLSNLLPSDHFNIVAFSTNARSFKPSVVPATAENIASARAFVSTLTALGLTNIHDALQASLTQEYVAGKQNTCVFLTDGEASWGETRTDVIADSAKKWNTQSVRLYTIGLGMSKYSLLERLAQDANGFYTQIEDGDSISLLIADHMKRISMPWIDSPAMAYGGLRTKEVLPSVLPNVSVGDRIMQFGRYEQGGLFPVTLTGALHNAPFTLTKDVLFGDPATNNRAVARLWARAKVDALLGEIELVGEHKELVDAIIDLSIRYNILTKYTALYADPDDPSTGFADEPLPIEIAGVQVSPNPVSSVATIRISLPQDYFGQNARIDVYDVIGQRVATIAQCMVTASMSIPWNVVDLNGAPLGMGTYTLVVAVGNEVFTSRFVVR
ncbi:MAG: VIT domain-containing protein [bacterium]|nr:VIT domain-containing protein [bacterium]